MGGQWPGEFTWFLNFSVARGLQVIFWPPPWDGFACRALVHECPMFMLLIGLGLSCYNNVGSHHSYASARLMDASSNGGLPLSVQNPYCVNGTFPVPLVYDTLHR